MKIVSFDQKLMYVSGLDGSGTKLCVLYNVTRVARNAAAQKYTRDSFYTVINKNNGYIVSSCSSVSSAIRPLFLLRKRDKHELMD